MLDILYTYSKLTEIAACYPEQPEKQGFIYKRVKLEEE